MNLVQSIQKYIYVYIKVKSKVSVMIGKEDKQFSIVTEQNAFQYQYCDI